MSTYKDQLQKYYNSKYFMSNPDNWQELANQAVARDLAKYQEDKLYKGDTLDEIVVTPKGTITKVPAVETDFTPHENKILATPDKKTIHYSDYEGRKNMLEAQSAANKVALGLGVGVAPIALGALLDAGVGAGAAQLAKHAVPLAKSAFKYAAPKILQGFKYLNYLDPFTKEFASMGIGKQAAVGALESIGLADAIQNTGEFVKNPSWNKVPDAIMNTLYALPYANAIKSGIRTSNTVNKIGKYIDNAIDATKYNTKAKALIYGSLFAAEHPQIVGNLLKIKPGIDPSKSKMAQFKLNIKNAINNYNYDNASEKMFIVPPDITSTNGIWHLFSIPRFDLKTGRKLSFHLRATLNPLLLKVIRDHRYTPLMNFGEKRAYIKLLNLIADDALEYIKKFNKYADDAHVTDKMNRAADFILTPEEIAARENYLNALEKAEIQGIPYTSKKFRDLAKTFNLTDDLISSMQLIYQSNPSRAISNDIEYSKNIQDPEYQKETFSVMNNRKAPKLTFVKDTTVPLEEGWIGLYNPISNTVKVVVKENPRILKHPLRVSRTLAHEYDHWAQRGIPRVNDTEILPYKARGLRPYYTVNINSPAATEFPELQGVPYVAWGSSPHEWRSEMAGHGFSHNLPADVKLWTKDDMEKFSRYLQGLELIRNMTQLTRQNNTFANFDPAYTTQKMVLKGYESGGKLNYTNLF